MLHNNEKTNAGLSPECFGHTHLYSVQFQSGKETRLKNWKKKIEKESG